VDIINPLTSRPEIVSEGDDITIAFNFTKCGNPITDNIDVLNITIGVKECVILIS